MGDKARDPRARALSPIRTVFGHGLCNLCHCRIQLFLPCYSSGDVTSLYNLAGIYTI